MSAFVWKCGRMVFFGDYFSFLVCKAFIIRISAGSGPLFSSPTCLPSIHLVRPLAYPVIGNAYKRRFVGKTICATSTQATCFPSTSLEGWRSVISLLFISSFDVSIIYCFKVCPPDHYNLILHHPGHRCKARLIVKTCPPRFTRGFLPTW